MAEIKASNQEEINDRFSNMKMGDIEKKIKNYNKKYANITESIKIDNNFIKYNTPLKIEFKNKIFNLSTRDYYDSVQCTWKCLNYRKIKGKPNNFNNFCDGTIRGIRDISNSKLFIFFLIENHSSPCLKEVKYTNEKETMCNIVKSNVGNDLDKDTSLSQLKHNINDGNIRDNITLENNNTNDIKINLNKDIYKPINSKSHNIINKNDKNENCEGVVDFNFSNDLLKKASSFNTEQELDNFILSFCKANKKFMEGENKFIKTFAFLYEKKILKLKNIT